MQRVYTDVAGLTTAAAVVCAAVGLITAKLDSYMGSLGVNLGRTGGGLGGLGALMMAGRLLRAGTGLGSSSAAKAGIGGLAPEADAGTYAGTSGFDSYGIMQSGWRLIGDAWYYFSESGQMADGENEIDGVQVWFENVALVDPYNDEAHRKASYANDRTEAEILQAEEKIRQAVEYCSQGKTSYEKAYRICDWRKEHLYYDLNGPYDVVGALNAGGTICEGYAVIYREIAGRLGFYCEKVVSWEMNHAWNFIVVGEG